MNKPIKMWINGKVFTIQQLGNISKRQKLQLNSPSENHQENDQEEHSRLLHVCQEEGRFQTHIKVPKPYYTKILSLPQFDITEISENTETTIILPELNQDKGIIINSACMDKLNIAVKHIHSAIGAVRERHPPLQFTCIPCQDSETRQRFESLKKEILSMDEEVEGLHESIFMCPLKLHVTIDVYTLLDEHEKEEAIRALNDYKSKFQEITSKSGHLKLHIGTLACMNNNPKKVDVLYSKVKLADETQEHTLQKIVNDISEHFYHRGLARKYQSNVKLHMTIINTKYRKMAKKKKKRQSIDATKILERFKNYEFGFCNFDSIHLSHMTLKGEDGFYKPLAVIKLDENIEDKES